MYELRQSEARTAKYLSVRAFIFDELRQYGPAAIEAAPQMNSFLQRMRAREYDDQDIDSLAKALKTLPQVGMNTESLELLEVYSGVTSWQTAKGELLGDIAKAALASVTAEELKRLRAEPVRQ